MQHIRSGESREDLHFHSTVSEARECEADHLEAKAEVAAELANERWFEERGGGFYAGSPEEARDRFYDGLLEEARDRFGLFV